MMERMSKQMDIVIKMFFYQNAWIFKVKIVDFKIANAKFWVELRERQSEEEANQVGRPDAEDFAAFL